MMVASVSFCQIPDSGSVHQQQRWQRDHQARDYDLQRRRSWEAPTPDSSLIQRQRDRLYDQRSDRSRSQRGRRTLDYDQSRERRQSRRTVPEIPRIELYGNN